MNTALQVILLIIIFSNSIFVMLEKNIFPSKIFKLNWVIALVDILVIFFFFKLNESIIPYIVFTVIIVISGLGFKTFVKGDNRQRLINFFVYFLLLLLTILTVGVIKNLLFDSSTADLHVKSFNTENKYISLQ
ncbi:hypothetical protein [Chryseobacterium sp. OV279]|uniref:hypothetical protein n=1 Tax=Chryseobacterium sp. OV279 TaxID=1500285 RepID=UPI00091CF72D|nr:hypothetical protein [Chryseobacterium sp. OV279]SHG29754.1 hypothetical protein SAMN02787100_3728 [Chryseobacterium sp. OV279]